MGTKSANIYEEHPELKAAYLAGALDGEGCILVGRHGGRNTFQAYVIVTNANPDFLKIVVKFVFDVTGYVPYIARKSSTSGKLAVYYVKIQRKDAIRKLLEATLPHLTGKREQAEVMLNLLRLNDGTNRKRLPKHALESAYYELRRLKQVSYDNTEVILQELRSVGHRNAQVVSLNNNPPKSAPRESENVR